jgi:hypothetical protein
MKVHVSCSNWCAPEKTWVFGVLSRWLQIPIELDLSTLEAESSSHQYQFTFPNGSKLMLADSFFSKVVEPGVYGAQDLPKAAIPILLSNSQDSYYALYGDAQVQVSERHVSLGADLVGTMFFMLTRWEEAVNEHQDALGRLDAPFHFVSSSTPALSDIPFLDAYVDLFHTVAQMLDVEWQRPTKRSVLQLSCDIDTPIQWPSAVHGRFATALSALVRRRDLGEALYWLRYTHAPNRPADPCDTYDHLMQLAESAGHKCTFYMLGERPSHYDHYYDLRDARITAIIKRIEERGHQIGFHPSKEAHQDAVLFGNELKGLQSFVNQQITHVRTHYLCGSFPITWQIMAAHGLTVDSSIGYHTKVGFRCGTSRQYELFDIEQRKPLGVLEQPLIVMDVALKAGLEHGASEEAAFDMLKQIDQKIAVANGCMTLLWHNSSFYTHRWYPYARISEKYIAYYNENRVAYLPSHPK